MLDFPNSPTVGQQFTAAGVTWTWDGTKWTASGLSVAYLPLTGGTLTGNLIISLPSGQGTSMVALNSTVSNTIIAQRSGLTRWEMDLGDTGAESGGNAGSNFVLKNYADAGGALGTPLSINRASGQVTIPNLSAPQAIGDNRIINGDMRIDVRNNGVGGTASGYTIDRWRYDGSQASKGTWGRYSSSGSPGFPYLLGFGSSSAYAVLAGDYFVFGQRLEADMVSDFAWGTANAQPVTLSFLVNASLTGTFGGTIRNGANNRSYPFTYSIPTANVWTKIVVTIPGDTAGTWVMSGNAYAMDVNFGLGVGATYSGPASAWAAGNYLSATGAVSVVGTNGAAFNLTGVKLEVGSVATPFNRKSMARSLADCQRYYQSIYTLTSGYNAAGATTYTEHALQTQMRATPTAVLTGIGYSNASALAFTGIDAYVFRTTIVTTALGYAYANGTVQLSAEL